MSIVIPSSEALSNTTDWQLEELTDKLYAAAELLGVLTHRISTGQPLGEWWEAAILAVEKARALSLGFLSAINVEWDR